MATTYPVIYYNKKWEVAPKIVNSDAEAAALDPSEWTTIPPPATPPPPEFPLIYFDVNVPPIVVESADDLAKLDTSRYKRFQVSQDVITAAQANLTAGA